MSDRELHNITKKVREKHVPPSNRQQTVNIMSNLDRPLKKRFDSMRKRNLRISHPGSITETLSTSGGTGLLDPTVTHIMPLLPPRLGPLSQELEPWREGLHPPPPITNITLNPPILTHNPPPSL